MIFLVNQLIKKKRARKALARLNDASHGPVCTSSNSLLIDWSRPDEARSPPSLETLNTKTAFLLLAHNPRLLQFVDARLPFDVIRSRAGEDVVQVHLCHIFGPHRQIT